MPRAQAGASQTMPGVDPLPKLIDLTPLIGLYDPRFGRPGFSFGRAFPQVRTTMQFCRHFGHPPPNQRSSSTCKVSRRQSMTATPPAIEASMRPQLGVAGAPRCGSGADLAWLWVHAGRSGVHHERIWGGSVADLGLGSIRGRPSRRRSVVGGES